MKNCTRCGALMNDYDRFCNNCGARVEEPTDPVQTVTVQDTAEEMPAVEAAAPVVQTTVAAPEQKPPLFAHRQISEWDGSVAGLFFLTLGASLLTLITLGIGAPWATCMELRYIIGHVTIEGRRLAFDGKGGQLFGRILLWTLLTIVTLGIYSFWVLPNMYRWVTSHIRFVEQA